jgi:hypothetical protein
MIGSYERTAEKLLKGLPKGKPFCKVIGGKLLVGVRTTHRTEPARRYNLFWRIKSNKC